MEKVTIYFGTVGDVTGLSTNFTIEIWTNDSALSIPESVIVT